jgi:hypothetical protein
MHRFLLVFVLAILASCSDPRAQAKKRLQGLDRQALRLDAAKLYKQIYAAPGSDFLTLRQSQWPETFSALKPVSVSCHGDGFSIALTDDSINETGLHVQPLGFTSAPTAGSVKYERIEEGIYWYSFKK